MRHDPYHSPWRRVAFVLGLTLLTALIVWGVVRTGQGAVSTPPKPMPTATSTGAPAPTGPAVQTSTDPALIAAIYSFVEAYNLPASDHRNQLLKKLSTAEGYGMVYRDPSSMSTAEKAAGNIIVRAVPGDTSIQVEPFDDDTSAVSVYVLAMVRIERDGAVLNTLRLPAQTTSWVKESGGWKFAFIQP